MTKMFRVLAAKKAKFGFASLRGISPTTLQDFAGVQRYLMNLDPSAKFELNFNMGANECRIYTDDSVTAELFKVKYCD